MERNTLLIVDDQQEILNSLRRLFQKDYDVFTTISGKEALKILKTKTISVILSDQRMPEMDGVSLLKETVKIQPDAIRIMITGYADIEASINAVNEANIYQYISKPFEPDELKLVLKSAVEKYNLLNENRKLQQKLFIQNQQLLTENTELKSHFSEQLDLGKFIGSSPSMQHIYKLVRKVKDTPTTVLLLGETGTGKEMLAKMIHFNSNRKEKLFVAQNCGAIPDTLLQSELFGHVKGSFTGAINDRIGLFEQASKGTIFLDEIGDTSQAFQLGLLRVLQEEEVKPVGSAINKKVDVRVIAATNKNLEKDVEEGRFREDLYYRLNVFPIKIPPLRERKEDIPELIKFFVNKYSERISKKINGFETSIINTLSSATFQGNVRELENEIERMVTMADNNAIITRNLLSEKFLSSENIYPKVFKNISELKPAIFHLEKTLISNALSKTKGNILKSAVILGISRVGLHKMLSRHKIDAKNFK